MPSLLCPLPWASQGCSSGLVAELSLGLCAGKVLSFQLSLGKSHTSPSCLLH